MKNRGYSRLKCSCQVHPPDQQHYSERWLTNPLLKQSGHHFVIEPWMFGRQLPSPASPALSLFSNPPALLSQICWLACSLETQTVSLPHNPLYCYFEGSILQPRFGTVKSFKTQYRHQVPNHSRPRVVCCGRRVEYIGLKPASMNPATLEVILIILV